MCNTITFLLALVSVIAMINSWSLVQILKEEIDKNKGEYWNE